MEIKYKNLSFDIITTKRVLNSKLGEFIYYFEFGGNEYFLPETFLSFSKDWQRIKVDNRLVLDTYTNTIYKQRDNGSWQYIGTPVDRYSTCSIQYTIKDWEIGEQKRFLRIDK